MAETLAVSEEEQVLERIVRNQLEIARLQEENDTLKQFFKQADEVYPVGTKKDVGKFYIRVTSNTRLDEGLARKELGTAWWNRVKKEALDTARAKAILPVHLREKITKTYENRIEVGLR